MKRLAFWSTLFPSGALAVALAWYVWAPLTVAVEQPRRGPAVEAVYGSGTVEPSVMLPLAPKIPGRLLTLAADEGDRVTRGQILARLDGREISALVAEWEARVQFATTQFQRATELFKNRSGTAVAVDQAKNELNVARASLERVRQQLAETTLAAPADGVVIRRDGEIGQLIQAGETIFWLACCETRRITTEIDEEDIARVQSGQRVVIRADAFPGRLMEGTVAEITPKGDPVTRTFRVRIALPEDSPLMIGMTADINIVVAERAQALLVPATAVSEGWVWVVDDNRLRPVAVTTGVIGDAAIEIKGGIGEDDRIVLHPTSRMREGRRVTVGSSEEP